MKDVVVVAPLQDIYDKTLDIIKTNKYHNVEVVLGNVNEGLVEAQKAVQQGAKILVSRGGTYRLLKKYLDVPIVEIRVDAYDIINSVQFLDKKEKNIGVIGYGNVIYGFDILRNILPLNIQKVEVESEEEIPDVISKYQKMGISTFIGDGTLAHNFQEQGCHTILISSQKNSILSAIQEARRILQAARFEKQRTQQLMTITDFISIGLLAIDKEQKITVFNKTAEEIFHLKKEDVVGHFVNNALSGCALPNLLSSRLPQIGNILAVGQNKIAINRIPILVDNNIEGAVATFQDVTDMQNIEQKIRRQLHERGFLAKYTFQNIIYKSEKMKQCIETARQFSQYDTPILILGESGVGKEMLCQSIHNSSPRRNGPFVAINCAAIPPSLIESEFFGYAKGSFTGADKMGKAGIFELAHTGTVFLDEISEIPLELQGRLLRVLQEKEIMRLGDEKIIPIDVKIICASNKDLHKMVVEGKFRKDLYFRIHILSLHIPSLYERREDILPLAKFFVQKYSKRYKKKPLEMLPEVEDNLLHRHYEGNVRELEGLMERSVVLSSFDGLFESLPQLAAEPLPMTERQFYTEDLQSAELRYIMEVYRQNSENTNKACKILKISRSTLWRKLKECEDV